MEIYNYRKEIFIISKFELWTEFQIDHGVNIQYYACKPVFCLEIFFLQLYHTPYLRRHSFITTRCIQSLWCQYNQDQMYIFAIHCNTLHFKLLYLLTTCVWLTVTILSNSSCYVMKFKYCYIYWQWTQQSFIDFINNATCFGLSYWPSSYIKYKILGGGQIFPEFESSAQTRCSSGFYHYIPQAYNILN